MMNRLLVPIAVVCGALAFNAFNASKVGMEKISGKWACTLTRPDGATSKVVETFNYSGDSWGAMTETRKVPGGTLKTELSFASTWSASETSLHHKYKDLSFFSAKLNGVDLGEEAREDALKGMRGEERTSKITLLTEDVLNYESDAGKIACKRMPLDKPKLR